MFFWVTCVEIVIQNDYNCYMEGIKMNDTDKFKNRLKELRKEHSITQQELADKIGIVRTAITNYETGRTIPDSETLSLIAKILNTTTDYLLGNSDIRNPYNDQILTKKDEKDIAKDLENTLNRLETSQDGLMFDGEALDDETRELLKISLENSMRLAKQMAKKYTPKKYRK